MFGKKEIETLKEENNLLKQENEKLKGSYGVSKSKELKEEIAIYREEEEKLKELIDEKIEKIRDLNNKLDDEKSRRLEIEGTLNFYRQSDLDLKNKNQKLQSDYNELLDNFNVANQEIEKLNQDIAVKDLEITAYKQAISNISLTFQKGETQDKPKPKKESKGEQ